MTFYLYGLSGHERMPLEVLFDGKRKPVEEIFETSAGHAIEPKGDHQEDYKDERHHHADHAGDTYQAVGKLPEDSPVLLASEIMTSPVVTLTPQAMILEALTLVREKKFRHIPVLTTEGTLVGMVSDRDILRCIGGITEDYRQQTIPYSLNDQVKEIMSGQVLVSGIDTDIRLIARLFVEQRVGAMPIVTDRRLIGILTRSDILQAVMRHYVFELWA